MVVLLTNLTHCSISIKTLLEVVFDIPIAIGTD